MWCCHSWALDPPPQLLTTILSLLRTYSPHSNGKTKVKRSGRRLKDRIMIFHIWVHSQSSVQPSIATRHTCKLHTSHVHWIQAKESAEDKHRGWAQKKVTPPGLDLEPGKRKRLDNDYSGSTTPSKPVMSCLYFVYAQRYVGANLTYSYCMIPSTMPSMLMKCGQAIGRSRILIYPHAPLAKSFQRHLLKGMREFGISWRLCVSLLRVYLSQQLIHGRYHDTDNTAKSWLQMYSVRSV